MSFPLDGVAVLEAAIRRTQPLVDEAPADVRDRVWLYRSEARRNAGTVCCMTETLFNYNVRKLVARHALRGDGGSLLVLNV